MDFKSHLSKPRTSLQAYIDFKFHISKPRTSPQAYFDLKLPFHSQSIIEKCELYVCCTPWKQQAANNNKNYICTGRMLGVPFHTMRGNHESPKIPLRTYIARTPIKILRPWLFAFQPLSTHLQAFYQYVLQAVRYSYVLVQAVQYQPQGGTRYLTAHPPFSTAV